mgnify:FL=1
MGKVLRILFAIVGAAIGLVIMGLLSAYDILVIENMLVLVGLYVLFFLLGFFTMFYFSKSWVNKIVNYFNELEKKAELVPVSDLFLGTIGLILGLVIAFLISQTVSKLEIPFVGNTIGIILSIIIYVILGFTGIRIALANKEDIKKGFASFKKKPEESKKENKKKIDGKNKKKEYKGVAKILDTSVIIDGRIKEIIDTGFLEGPLVVPNFVLEELQGIADSEDSIKRQRGRRGLDIIKDIKDNSSIEVIVDNRDYPEIDQVDMKLLKMTKDYGGKVVTNDYNLNKIAVLQEIKVLNVNELANAIKAVVYPGETIKVTIVKEGKGRGQGIGYLDDGTMIVIENGKDLIGKTVDAVVTSVIQTAAGKMIFGKSEN